MSQHHQATSPTSPRPIAHPSHGQTRIWRQIEVFFLAICYIAIVAIGIVSWASGAKHWGIVLDSQGPQPCSTVASNSSCEMYWRIASAASASVFSNDIHAGMVVCQYDDHPIQATTTAT